MIESRQCPELFPTNWRCQRDRGHTGQHSISQTFKGIEGSWRSTTPTEVKQ